MLADRQVEDLLRRMAPQVLGALVRRYGHFATAEDAVQEALLAAASQWPTRGIPQHPRGCLITVASPRLTDLLRGDLARRRREDTAARRELPLQHPTSDADALPADADDTLILLVLCAHPALDSSAQIALTLRGRRPEHRRDCLGVPGVRGDHDRRISRAKQRITASGIAFAMSTGADRATRVDTTARVLYLIITEGYTASTGTNLQRPDLAREAIRLTRVLHQLLPEDSEIAGLLALMLLTDARRPARTGAHGKLIPLPEQDRSRWDTALITEGIALITAALQHGLPGRYRPWLPGRMYLSRMGSSSVVTLPKNPSPFPRPRVGRAWSGSIEP